jgi:2-dehydro-3-deoxyphosphogluconate aldolase/(4S)-4-hydroxy-2-oxoglutarate aldolase
MHEVLKRLGDLGIIPVVKIEDASLAADLGRALCAGDLPVAEITFRTEAAEAAIRNLTREVPNVLVGAGTVLSVEQVKKAVGAGAKFIVSPGFNPRVVDYCIHIGVPVTPGISSPTEIEMALERGLEVVKFFPAGASGGVTFLKAIAAPFSGLKFIPTGGIEATNLRDYLSFDRVFAVGGTWIAKEATIASGKFDEISRLAREAVVASLGFELAHVGVNTESSSAAGEASRCFESLFSFLPKEGANSITAGAVLEFMKSPYLGQHGHLAIATLSIPRALDYLGRKGVKSRPETSKEKDGKLIAIYLDRDVAGFAIHLLQK